MFKVICDIDDTLCDSAPRWKAIQKKHNAENQWTMACCEEFLNSIDLNNDPMVKGAELLLKFVKKLDAELIFLTGRSKMGEKGTRDWLHKHFHFNYQTALYMRADNDFSMPWDCKEKLFLDIKQDGEKYIFIEDDPEIRKMFSKYGIVLRAPEVWEMLSLLITQKPCLHKKEDFINCGDCGHTFCRDCNLDDLENPHCGCGCCYEVGVCPVCDWNEYDWSEDENQD